MARETRSRGRRWRRQGSWKPWVLRLAVIVAVGLPLSSCGSSGNSKTAIGQHASSQTEDQVASEVRKASSCTKVIHSFSALAKNLGVSGSSVATISSTKENLHELAEVSTGAATYTISRLTQVLSRLEKVTNKALEQNYSEAHRELPILGAESSELIGKVLAICGKSQVSGSCGADRLNVRTRRRYRACGPWSQRSPTEDTRRSYRRYTNRLILFQRSRDHNCARHLPSYKHSCHQHGVQPKGI